MIPEKWAETTIGEVLERVSLPVSVDPDAEYQQIGIRSHGKGLFDKNKVSGRELGNKRVFLIEPNCFIVNIVFAWEQAVGKTTEMDRGKIASHRFPMYRPKRSRCDVDFIDYLFKTPKGKYLLGLASPGGAGRNKTLGQKEFDRISLILPPLAEQKKIAEILSFWDKAIETTQKLLSNAERQKRALMQQLLMGKLRFSEFAGKSWREVRLAEICEVRRGASPRPIKDPKWFAEHGRGWVRISDVTKGETAKLLRTKQYLSELGASKSVSVDPGELIMSICATIGVPRIVGIPVCIHDGFVVFRKTERKLVREFLYYFIQLVSERLKNSGQPGTQKNLNTTIVGDILVPDISLHEQSRIADALTIADDEVLVNRRNIEKLRSEKRALMQQLLTGKRRVKI